MKVNYQTKCIAILEYASQIKLLLSTWLYYIKQDSEYGAKIRIARTRARHCVQIFQPRQRHS